MKIFKQLALMASLVGLPIPLKAALDVKHAAEQTAMGIRANARPAAAAAAAVIEMDAQPASAAASATAQTAQAVVVPAGVTRAKLLCLKPPKTILAQAIANNDITFVEQYVAAYPDQRATGLTEAALAEKPDILLALAPKGPEDVSREHLLNGYFYKRADLTTLDVKIYHRMHDLIKQKEEESFTKITECVGQKNVLASPGLAQLVAQMLHPTLRTSVRKNAKKEIVSKTHPELEQAIRQGDVKRVAELTKAGWLVKGEDQGLGALKQAAHAGRTNIVSFLPHHMPWIGDESFQALRKKYSNDDNKKYYEVYNALMDTMVGFPISDTIMDALNNNHPGQLLQALEQGANQRDDLYTDEDRDEGGGPSFSPLREALLHPNPVFLQILVCDRYFNPEARIEDEDNKKCPVLAKAVLIHSLEKVQILLDAGCDPNVVHDQNPIVCLALLQNDPNYLKAFIDTGRFDINTRYQGKGNTYPILFGALGANQFNFKLLLAAGCDINALDSTGNSIAKYSLDFDPAYLKMLTDTKKLNPNTCVKLDDGYIMPLLSYAIKEKRKQHMQILLDAGFDPNILDCRGISVAFNALSNPDPAYLKMLIDTKRLNFKIKYPSGDIESLLSCALRNNYQLHAQLLLDAGAPSCATDHKGNHLPVIALPLDKTAKEQSESRLAAAVLSAVAWAQEAAGQAKPAAAAAQASQDADAGTSVGGKRKAQSDGTSNKKPKNDQ